MLGGNDEGQRQPYPLSVTVPLHIACIVPIVKKCHTSITKTQTVPPYSYAITALTCLQCPITPPLLCKTQTLPPYSYAIGGVSDHPPAKSIRAGASHIAHRPEWTSHRELMLGLVLF